MSKKLLLADDSITIQKVIQITFAHEDYELTITDNGDAALAKAQEIMPDLIMTDIYMPGKNGYELTHAIKQDPALRHVPVLLLAGSFEPFDEDKARSCKADAWIEKPFESQSLIDKVAELLSVAQPVPETTAAAADSELFAADGEPAGEDVAFETPMAADEELVGEDVAFETPMAADEESAGEDDAFETPMAADDEPAGEDVAFETPMAADDEPVGEDDAFETPMAADDELLGENVAFEAQMSASDVPASSEPEEVATPEGSSAEIPFEEEVPAAETVVVAEDRSAFAEEDTVAAPVVEDTFTIAEDFSLSEEEPSTEMFEDFSFSDEESASEIIEDFSFTDEGPTSGVVETLSLSDKAPVSADDFAPLEKASTAEAGFDGFGMDEDEIMPLDDEDILGAEDLEPIMPEQTLASWSRDESAAIDAFAESLEEEPALGREPDFEAPMESGPVEETSAFYDDEPEAEPTHGFEGSAEPVTVDEPAPVVEESEPAVVDAALADVGAQVSALSEEAFEKIVEKIVTQVVEKLAGSILERVAWEVVPDLAESLIREEIRKIKDTAA
jgi:CheY-like chemotaxis protein